MILLCLSTLRPMPSPCSVFQTDLATFGDICQRPNPNPEDLQSRFLAMQQEFQQQLLPLGDDDGLDRGALQPLLTEMNRMLRLMAMDVAFLQTARQPMTQQQRQRQLLTKLAQLGSFSVQLQQVVDRRPS